MSGSKVKSITDRAIKVMNESPRIKFSHIKDNPGAKTQGRVLRSYMNKGGKSHKELQIAAKPPLGWIFGDWYRPWQRRFPAERLYNKDIHLRREYPPLSLLELQRLIDLGWLDVNQPIDLTKLCNTKRFVCDPTQRQFGVQLTDEGADVFAARINVEVQWASELAIAAIERNGGVITCAYYDPISLGAVVDPMNFFRKGEPIPKRAFPPADLMDRYVDPKLRGYLADPEKIREAQIELSQKYGYSLLDSKKDPNYENFRIQKDPLQCFHGLEPGWIVNLADRTILKPKDEEIQNFYNS